MVRLGNATDHAEFRAFQAGMKADFFEADDLRIYRDVKGPTMIVRCTDSDAPRVLDVELDALASVNDLIELVRLPLTHLAPAWDALDAIVLEVERFLASPWPREFARATAGRQAQTSRSATGDIPRCRVRSTFVSSSVRSVMSFREVLGVGADSLMRRLAAARWRDRGHGARLDVWPRDRRLRRQVQFFAVVPHHEWRAVERVANAGSTELNGDPPAAIEEAET
jgi:hypothetical protein